MGDGLELAYMTVGYAVVIEGKGGEVCMCCEPTMWISHPISGYIFWQDTIKAGKASDIDTSCRIVSKLWIWSPGPPASPGLNLASVMNTPSSLREGILSKSRPPVARQSAKLFLEARQSAKLFRCLNACVKWLLPLVFKEGTSALPSHLQMSLKAGGKSHFTQAFRHLRNLELCPCSRMSLWNSISMRELTG